MANPKHDERLEKIETTVAHLERLLEQLNQIVTEQSDAVRRLQVQQQRMGQALEGVELDRIKSTNAKPPHWG